MFSASPALVENELYLRGERYLYCISEVNAAGKGATPEASATEEVR